MDWNEFFKWSTVVIISFSYLVGSREAFIAFALFVISLIIWWWFCITVVESEMRCKRR